MKTGDVRIDKIMPNLNPVWETVDFEDALDRTPTVSKIKLTTLNKIGLLPVIDQGDNFIAGYIDNIDYAYSGELPVIIFGDHTRRFKLIDFSFCIGADGCKILKPKPFLDIRFFYNYLWSLNIVSNGYSRHYKFLKEIKVPIPELSEQRRIVARLETLLSGLNNATNRLGKIPAILRRFRQSVLSAACSGRLTEGWRTGKDLPEWESVPVESVCSSISDGDHQPPPQTKSGVPFLVISNITSGKLDFSNTRFVSEEYFNDLSDKKIARKGDVLYSIVGSYGIPVMIDTDDKFCFQRHMALFKPKNINSKYLLYVLKSLDFYNMASDIATGTAQMTVPMKGLRKIPIPVPSLSEQQEIVRRVDALFALADSIEQQYNAAKGALARAEKALYKKAFSGEL